MELKEVTAIGLTIVGHYTPLSPPQYIVIIYIYIAISAALCRNILLLNVDKFKIPRCNTVTIMITEIKYIVNCIATNYKITFLNTYRLFFPLLPTNSIHAFSYCGKMSPCSKAYLTVEILAGYFNNRFIMLLSSKSMM